MISKWCCVPPCSPFHRSQDSCWLRAPFPTIQAVRWCPKLRAGSPATAALDAPVAASARGWRRETSFRWKWRRTARRWGQRQTGGEGADSLIFAKIFGNFCWLGGTSSINLSVVFFFAAASRIFSPWFRCFVDATPLIQRDPVWICPGSFSLWTTDASMFFNEQLSTTIPGICTSGLCLFNVPSHKIRVCSKVRDTSLHGCCTFLYTETWW